MPLCGAYLRHLLFTSSCIVVGNHETLVTLVSVHNGPCVLFLTSSSTLAFPTTSAFISSIMLGPIPRGGEHALMEVGVCLTTAFAVARLSV